MISAINLKVIGKSMMNREKMEKEDPENIMS